MVKRYYLCWGLSFLLGFKKRVRSFKSTEKKTRELFFSRLRHVLSHGVSAPVFVSSAQMAEVVSTREGSLLGVGVHFHGVEVFSRPTQELWHRKSSGKFLEEILLGWILMNQNSQMNKCRKGSPDRERAQPGTIRRQVSKRASARSWRYRRLCWGIWPDPGRWRQLTVTHISQCSLTAACTVVRNSNAQGPHMYWVSDSEQRWGGGASVRMWEVVRCSPVERGSVTIQLELIVAMWEYGPALHTFWFSKKAKNMG